MSDQVSGMCESLLEIKPCLRQAVKLMEALYCSDRGPLNIQCPSGRGAGPSLTDGVKKLEEELTSLEYSPQKAVLVDQTEAIWNVAVRRKIPAIWFIRSYEPTTVLLSAILEKAGVPITRLLNAELTQRDFAVLTSTVGRFAGAPLRICDARQPAALLNLLPTLFSENPPCCVLCDWHLEDKELATAHQLGKESEISFLCPCHAVC
jgi:hypothetical protein